MHRSALTAATLAAAAALLGAATVDASDDDEDPPYMIYIDPETGKYTTTDPLAATAPAKPLPRPVDGARTPGGSGPSRVLLAGAAAALLLVLGGGRALRRRRHTAIPGKHAGTPV